MPSRGDCALQEKSRGLAIQVKLLQLEIRQVSRYQQINFVKLHSKYPKKSYKAYVGVWISLPCGAIRGGGGMVETVDRAEKRSLPKTIESFLADSQTGNESGLSQG